MNLPSLVISGHFELAEVELEEDELNGALPDADTLLALIVSRSAGAVWFQRAYSGNPICSPTRASLLTGRTPARTCIYNVDHHILCRAGGALPPVSALF